MLTKPFRVARCVLILLFYAHSLLAHDSARKYRVKFDNEPIKSALEALITLSGQAIFYNHPDLPAHWRVTIDTYGTIPDILSMLFAGKPFTILTDGNDIYIRLKERRRFSLLILNQEGLPLEGVSIQGLDSSVHGLTGTDGRWIRMLPLDSLQLSLSMVGHFADTVTIQADATVFMRENRAAQQEVVTIAYGKTSNKLSVGNIQRLSPEFVGKPYTNVQDVLRLASGVLTRSRTDVPWGNSSMEIYGSRSIQPLSAGRQVDEPLVLVEGLPCPARMGSLSQLSSVVGDAGSSGAGLNPLSFLNIEDVESVTVLKDAAATAIYGARGANGVILVTLRKPASKQVHFNAFVQTGVTRSYRRPQTLNTQQYLALRHEALGPNYVKSKASTPDLYLDSSRYTNWADELYNNTGGNQTVQLSANGGAGAFYWLGSLNYRRGSYVFPGTNKDEWVRLYGFTRYQPAGKRFSFSSFVAGGVGSNVAPAQDLSSIVYALPHASGTVSDDSLAAYDNPMRLLNTTYQAQSDSYLANLELNYKLWPFLSARLHGGFSWQQLKEKASYPLSSKTPDTANRGSRDQAAQQVMTWVAEPQLLLHTRGGQVEWQGLLGANYQQSRYRSVTHVKDDYKDDYKLRNETLYPRVDTSWTPYKLLSLFARLNATIAGRYVVEGSVREDVSSRFARGHRTGWFYSMGGAWIFSSARFWRFAQKEIPFAKLRLSHGLTGNDLVGDYTYMGQYGPTNVAYPYGPYPGLVQSLPANSVLTWARTKKTEAGLQLEWRNRLGLEVGYFAHRSYDQYIRLPLSSQSGYSELNYWNFPAVVDNRGWDLSLSYKTDSGRRWRAAVTLRYTIPTNRLHAFPNLSAALVKQYLVQGQPLSASRYYHATGINDTTGLYTVADLDGDGSITPADAQVVKNLEIKSYGNLQLTLERGAWSFGLIVEGRQQPGFTAWYYANNRLDPGSLNEKGFGNQPASVMNRWPAAQDALYQRAADRPSLFSPAGIAMGFHQTSDAVFTDQSYLCLRHLAVQYTIHRPSLLRGAVDQLSLIVQGQNLLVWSGYQEGNPMLTQPFSQPVTRVLSLGVQVSFK